MGHHARTHPPAHPAGKLVSSTGRSRVPELRDPPSTPTVPAASLEKSFSHDGKAQGENDCRQMGLMWTRTSEHFFLPLGASLPAIDANFFFFLQKSEGLWLIAGGCNTPTAKQSPGDCSGCGKEWGDLDLLSPGEQTFTFGAE